MAAKLKKTLALMLVLVVGAIAAACQAPANVEIKVPEVVVALPSPRHTGEMTVEQAIFGRRSVRRFTERPLSLAEVSQLLWAAGGKTVDALSGPTRAFPSAGGIYPFEIYLVSGHVSGLTPGIYHFRWQDHSLRKVREGDLRLELTQAALGQDAIRDAPGSIVWVGDFPRVRGTYGERGVARYISMDVGGAGQNVHLQAMALNLRTVAIGAFHDDQVRRILGTELTPLYIVPVGQGE